MALKKKTSTTMRSKTRASAQAKRPLPAPQEKFPIVGIGASAGGLEALKMNILDIVSSGEEG